MLLDWNETGYLSQEAFRPLAAMIGLDVSTDERYRHAYMTFCGEYYCQPDKGIETAWLRRWISDRNGEGYISGNVLHHYLFGVWPRPARKSTSVPPLVSSHPADVMTKTIQTVSTATPSMAPLSIFPPLPPGLTQPGSSSASTTPPAQPPTIAAFPKPPPSLRVDPYELMLPRIEDTHDDEDAEYDY